MDVKLPDGTVISNIPDGISKADLTAKLAKNGYDVSKLSTPSIPDTAVVQPKTEAPKNYTLGESLGNAAINLIPDIGHVAYGVGKTLLHPIDTAKGVIDLGAGALQNALPKQVVDFVNQVDANNPQAIESAKRAVNTANVVGQDYKNKYGSYEGFKRAVAEHPAEVMADVSTVLGGGAALTKGSKLGDILSAGSKYTNPLTPAVKVISAAEKVPGSIARQVLGVTTGVGADTIGEAFKAGKAGNQSFWNNLTGKADMTDVLDEAKNALNNIKNEKSQQYRSGMVNVGNDKTVLDFGDIDNSIANATGKVSYKGQVKDKFASAKVNEASDAINQWKNLDPAQYHTPEGLDALKQKIGGILESIPFEQKTARSAVQDIYNSTKQTITNQAPSYANVMKDYAQASDLVSQIEKTLSLNPKASVDTAMRKLQSLTRNNVQTNYGQRVKLAEELAKHGGENIMPSLAGQAMNEWLPRGLVGKGEDIAAILGATHMSPSTLLFPLAMPRVVGAGAYGLGKVASKIPKLPMATDKANSLAQYLYQMQNAQNQGEQ